MSKPTYSLDLRMDGNGFAHIVLKSFSTNAESTAPHIAWDCASVGEVEGLVRNLKDELDALVVKAREEFAKKRKLTLSGQ